MTAAEPACSTLPLAPGPSLSTGEVAVACGVTTRTVLRWLHTGLLPSLRLANGHHRIPAPAVHRLLQRQGRPLPETAHTLVGVLVVDPCPDSAARTAERIRAAHPAPRVEVVHDAFGVGAELMRWTPRLMVFDPGTPGLDVLQLLRFLQDQPRLRATGLVLSAPSLDRQLRRHLFELGVHSAVPHPVLPRHVEALAARWLRD